MKAGWELRPITDADLEFLYQVYASTRTEELSLVPWSDEEKEQFLRSQFAAQHQHYQQHYAGSRFDLILLEGQPVGRLYVDRGQTEMRIIDIAILPEHRNRGLGGEIMRELLDEAKQAGQRVSIHVEKNNPALRFYERLEFERIGDTGVYWLMEWRG